jgi:hypothetical protein
MNAVSALIDENRYWRIGPGVRDALRHLLHNERIAHYKAKNLGRIRTLFLFKNLTEVESRELHEPRRPNRALNYLFEFMPGSGRVYILSELAHIGMPNRRLDDCNDLRERFGRNQAQPLDCDLTDCHSAPAYALDASRGLGPQIFLPYPRSPMGM